MEAKIMAYRKIIGEFYFWSFLLVFIINVIVKEIFEYFLETRTNLLEKLIQSFIVSVVLTWVLVSANRKNTIKEKDE